MAFRLRSIETTAQGRDLVRDRDLAGDSVTVGRSADNSLYLPDLSLDPYHATITQQADGPIAVEAVTALGFTLDGRQTRSATIDPQSGGELRFGSFRVGVSLDSDDAVLLTVGEVPEAERIDEATGFSLKGKLWGKRSLSWFWAWPCWPRFSRCRSTVRSPGRRRKLLQAIAPGAPAR
jgi:hypothetical protein